MSLNEWRKRFAASASETLDLLDRARIRSRSLLRMLLETSHAEIEVDLAPHGQIDDVTRLEMLTLPDHPTLLP
ncbi:hypothetical protein [Nonomuraea sp. NPDC050310]|uniref:hypothetical protein n=1 Tax=Nonomuraea sp. NPDC050310 TaxID=3154935 RepID=UPI0033C6399F